MVPRHNISLMKEKQEPSGHFWVANGRFLSNFISSTKISIWNQQLCLHNISHDFKTPKPRFINKNRLLQSKIK